MVCVVCVLQRHSTVIQAVMLMFESLGLKCVPFLPQIMPPFLACMRTKEKKRLEPLFKQLCLLVYIAKQHIKVRPTIGALLIHFERPDRTCRVVSCLVSCRVVPCRACRVVSCRAFRTTWTRSFR